MSKAVNKKSYNNNSKVLNQNISAIDNVSNEVVTSLPTVGTDIKLKNRSDFNLTKALIQVMYKRGEINSATYEKAMTKLLREVEKHVKKK